MKYQSCLWIAAGLLGSCSINHGDEGPTKHETKILEMDKSEMARIDLHMGAGELVVEHGSPKFLEADFEYKENGAKPIVDYRPGALRGELKIDQSGLGVSNGAQKWRLKFNDSLPLDVKASLGAGRAELNLGRMNLRTVEVHMGAGEVIVDLRGEPKRDYDVQIHGGVGQATVYLPKDVAISATAAGGIGDISASGLEKKNGLWVNPDKENGPVTVHLDVKGGIGQINLVR